MSRRVRVPIRTGSSGEVPRPRKGSPAWREEDRREEVDMLNWMHLSRRLVDQE